MKFSLNLIAYQDLHFSLIALLIGVFFNMTKLAILVVSCKFISHTLCTFLLAFGILFHRRRKTGRGGAGGARPPPPNNLSGGQHGRPI